MNGPVETVSMPVPLQVGHLSGFEPGSQPVPLQDLHVSIMLTYISYIKQLRMRQGKNYHGRSKIGHDLFSWHQEGYIEELTRFSQCLNSLNAKTGFINF